jgi:hypothetical protein
VSQKLNIADAEGATHQQQKIFATQSQLRIVKLAGKNGLIFSNS